MLGNDEGILDKIDWCATLVLLYQKGNQKVSKDFLAQKFHSKICLKKCEKKPFCKNIIKNFNTLRWRNG
jgi:hypothetical protein